MSDLRMSDLLTLGREIWGDDDPTELGDIIDAVERIWKGLIDAAREGDRDDLLREIGNLMLSAPRWASLLGLDLSECVAAAEQAQRVWADRWRAEREGSRG